jgi:hypothetical protein
MRMKASFPTPYGCMGLVLLILGGLTVVVASAFAITAEIVK